MDKDNRTARIKCDCGTEILEIQYWLSDDPKVYYLTLYKATAGIGLWWRFKNALRYFFYGEFAGNEIVLQKEEYDAFVDMLISHKTE